VKSAVEVEEEPEIAVTDRNENSEQKSPAIESPVLFPTQLQHEEVRATC
jgi:hypothetical protein